MDPQEDDLALALARLADDGCPLSTDGGAAAPRPARTPTEEPPCPRR